MEDSAQPSFPDNRNTLDRNRPVALIVGCAGFIGSHLVDHFLKLKVQVIGIDDLLRGKISRLKKGIEDPNFFFYKTKIEDLDTSNVVTQLPRLDYAFFVAEDESSKTLLEVGVERFLEVAREFHFIQRDKERSLADKPKILFLSSIDLYDNKLTNRLKRLSYAEVIFARLSQKYNLNSRVVRIGEVFGPRMDLNQRGVFTRLIKATLDNEVDKVNPVQEFLVRAIYINDAVSLLSKSMLLGSTANKIFDGTSITPLKVEEIRQVLINPQWHDKEGFKFTELPPWETPNLRRSVKELSWRPGNNLVTSLNETFNYFKENPKEINGEGDLMEEEIEEPMKLLVNEKVKNLENVEKVDSDEQRIVEPEIKTKDEKPMTNLKSWSFKEKEEVEEPKKKNNIQLWPIINFLVLWIIVLVGIVYPIFIFTAGNIVIPNSLKKAKAEVKVGNYNAAQQEIGFGYLNAKEQDNLISSLVFLKSVGLFGKEIDSLKLQSNKNVETFFAAQQIVNALGKFVDDLSEGTLSREKVDQILRIEIDNQQIMASGIAQLPFGQSRVPMGIVDKESLNDFYNLSLQTQTAAQILPGILGIESARNYVFILQDNNFLKPTGGKFSSIVILRTEKGRVVNITPILIDDLDKKLPSNLEPEELVKNNLKIANLKISNSNFDADFPTFSRTFENLYRNSSGENLDGVFAMDLTAAGDLLNALGGITLDSGERISSAEQLATLIGSGDENKTGIIFKQLLLKLFAVNSQSVANIAGVLNKNLDEKHLLLFANESELSKEFIVRNWSGRLGTNVAEKGMIQDFSAVGIYSFTNSSQLSRDYSEKLTLSGQGVIQHVLTSNFVEHGDKSFSGEALFYFPIGAKLIKLDSGGSDITDKVTPFVKYGVSGVALPLDLKEGESKRVVLSYELPNFLRKGQGSVDYRYIFLKQPGTKNDDFSWSVSYPETLQIVNSSNSGKMLKNGEITRTNLETDKKIQLTLKGLTL